MDYEDFLRQRRLELWNKNHPQALIVRSLGWHANPKKDRTDPSDPTDPSDLPDVRYAPYRPYLEADAETVANTLICLIHQANFLLDRQIQGLERQFIKEGGYSERLAVARNREKMKARMEAESRQATPKCPKCGAEMMQRTARRGKHAGQPFWGCSQFPNCKGTCPIPST